MSRTATAPTYTVEAAEAVKTITRPVTAISAHDQTEAALTTPQQEQQAAVLLSEIWRAADTAGVSRTLLETAVGVPLASIAVDTVVAAHRGPHNFRRPQAAWERQPNIGIG